MTMYVKKPPRLGSISRTNISLTFAIVVAIWWIFMAQKHVGIVQREESHQMGSIDIPQREFTPQISNSTTKVDITELDQEDETLIRIVRDAYLIKPSTEGMSLADKNKKDHSMGQGEKIRQILGEMKDGFFVECGALDGETRSNSLYFERFLNWTGLLVEADPLNVEQVVQKKRKAWLAPTCLSLKRKPQIVKYMQARNIGKILSANDSQFQGKSTELTCIPITSLLLALNQTRIDYFSLDVEGNELDVLRTIDFNKFDIRTLSVEFSHTNEGKDALLQHMNQNGYQVHSNVTRSDYLAYDFIFFKK